MQINIHKYLKRTAAAISLQSLHFNCGTLKKLLNCSVISMLQLTVFQMQQANIFSRILLQVQMQFLVYLLFTNLTSYNVENFTNI